jgi:type II secretion system protein I
MRSTIQTRADQFPPQQRWSRRFPGARRHRRGITLLEVILAIVILGLSLVALGQLVRLGANAATKARDLTQAQVLCDTKISEIRAGILPLDNASNSPIDTAPDWNYSAVVTPSEQQPGLLIVVVTVTQTPTQGRTPVSFSLIRFMPDPEYQPETEE